MRKNSSGLSSAFCAKDTWIEGRFFTVFSKGKGSDLQLAASLTEELVKAKGFIRSERFSSLAEEDKLYSLPPRGGNERKPDRVRGRYGQKTQTAGA